MEKGLHGMLMENESSSTDEEGESCDYDHVMIVFRRALVMKRIWRMFWNDKSAEHQKKAQNQFWYDFVAITAKT